MRQLTLSGSESLRWSEPIIILGRGIPSWSRTYKRLVYCVIGIGESSGLLRLYPFFYPDNDLETFDIVKVLFREKYRHKLRPEDRKLHIGFVYKTDRLMDESTREELLLSLTENGIFMHDESWNGIKTIGVVQPITPYFTLRENKVYVKWLCNYQNCNWHTNEVTDFNAVDRVGRVRLVVKPEALREKLNQLRNGQPLWFVMGTHSYHPQKWILVEMIALG